MKISQSLLKDFKRYYYSKSGSSFDSNSCGLLFKAKYIDKNVKDKPSDSMKEGIYFEYLSTGALPKSGEIPEPERTLKGALTAAYQRASEAASFCKSIFEHYGIKILETAYVLETEDMIGTMDILAEWDGQPVIIDLKYSGLIDNKWDDLGWNTETLPAKENLMIQGVHYTLLAKEVLGMNMPFFFFVFNSKDSTDMKIIRQVIDEDQYEQHFSDVLKIKELIQKELEIGFTAIPNYRHCKDCPLSDTCQHKHAFPQPVTIYYGDNKTTL